MFKKEKVKNYFHTQLLGNHVTSECMQSVCNLFSEKQEEAKGI